MVSSPFMASFFQGFIARTLQYNYPDTGWDNAHPILYGGAAVGHAC